MKTIATKVKKIVVVAMILAMTMVLLTGCGGGVRNVL